MPARDQPVSTAIGCRNTASENSAPSATQDVIHDDEIAEAVALGMVGIEEAVDHRQPIRLPIGEAGADEPALLARGGGLAIFDHERGDRALPDHVGIIALLHTRHAAPGMPCREIPAPPTLFPACRPP